MAFPYCDFRFEAELAGAGNGWTDLSSYVAAVPIRWTRGIQGSGPGDLTATIGQCTVTLNNAADVASQYKVGYFSPRHADCLSGWGLDIACRFRLRNPQTFVWSTQFIGRADAISPAPGRYRSRRVEVTLVDWFDEASRWKLTPDIGEQVSKTGDQILTAILAEMPRQPVATSFDVGSDTYPYALDQSASSKQSALSEMAKLAASEQGPIYLTAGGTLRYERRHTRMLNTTIAWTMDDSVLHAADGALVVPSTRDDIIHTIRTTTHPKVVDALDTTVLYDQAKAVRVDAGDTVTVLGSFRDPDTGETIGGTDVQPLVASTDYTMHSDEGGAGTDLTSDLTVTATIGPSGARFALTNGGATNGYVTRLQVRGRGLYDYGAQDFEATDGDAGDVTLIDMPYQADAYIGQAAADFLLDKFGSSSVTVRSVMVRGTTHEKVTHLLAREISDRVRVVETVTGVDTECFINGVSGLYQPGGILDMTYTLAPASDAVSYWVLGVSTLGVDTAPAPF